MKNLVNYVLGSVFLMVLFIACSSDENEITDDSIKKEVVLNYASIVYKNYKDSYDDALTMQKAIDAFVNAPSQNLLDKAKEAWLSARESYGQTEVFRGSAGPIDTEGLINNEGQLNAWPLNEAFIDYVADKNSFTGTYDVSIISGDVEITEDYLSGKNEQGGDEKAVATGWHAIEFLLWGQDNSAPSLKQPGQRPVEDYISNKNYERRKKYLKTVTQLLIKDLKSLVDTWDNGGSYYNTFINLPVDEALTNMINGPYFLAAEEASNERMLVPAIGTDGIAGGEGQEDEHSCFSDNTHRDIYNNAKGVFNVLTGEYNGISGASFIDLLSKSDPAQALKLEEAIKNAKLSIEKIDEKAKSGTPFDLMIMEESLQNPGVVLAGDKALKALGDIIKESASKLGLSPVLPE